jgi:hypothetical protein
MKHTPLVTSVLGIERKQIDAICERALLKKADGALPAMDTNLIANFFDSGAFSIWTRVEEFKKATGGTIEDYYVSDEFMTYAKSYVEMIKTHPEISQFYANIDVIGNADLTWQNQQLLEGMGIKPVPVVHFGTDMKWMRHYVKRGYTYIGLGGLVGGKVGGSASADKGRWITEAFQTVCKAPTYLPSVRFHGFGVSTWKIIRKYPWYSVDSAAWAKLGAFGNIMVPRRRNGEWDFSGGEEIVCVSKESPAKNKADAHFFTMTKAEKQHVVDWLNEVCVPLGKLDDKGEVIEEGCITNGYIRRIAVLYTCELFRKHLPTWNRPFNPVVRKGLGLL